MNRQIALPQLGQHILIVIDHSPSFFSALQLAISHLPEISEKFFTLLCCCPAHYWGHIGDSTTQLQSYIESLWEEEQEEFALAEQCLDRGKSLLLDAGVSSEHILTITSTDDNLITATMSELRQAHYSGVIVSLCQNHIVNRLYGQGITDIFRHIPKVEVWTIDTNQEVTTTTQKE